MLKFYLFQNNLNILILLFFYVIFGISLTVQFEYTLIPNAWETLYFRIEIFFFQFWRSNILGIEFNSNYLSMFHIYFICIALKWFYAILLKWLHFEPHMNLGVELHCLISKFAIKLPYLRQTSSAKG